LCPLLHESQPVVSWLDAPSAETVPLKETSLSELRLEILPTGKRKDQLRAALADLLSTLFGSRFAF
jgi:hypothetical protein